MNILIISPSAPPKSGPEDIQVGRYLEELDKNHTITLVTTPVSTKGWVQGDKSLNVELLQTERMVLRLPFHAFALKLLRSKYLKFLSYPDGDFWIQYNAKEVLSRLSSKPEVIYSRSFPLSSVFLAKKLKESLKIPWVMHLSDPWADSPYIATDANIGRIQADELVCFEFTDAVMLTTESMAEFYKMKYPQYADKIHVSYNVMPSRTKNISQPKVPNKKLTLLYAGNFYGERKLTTLLNALRWLGKNAPKQFMELEIFIAGNMIKNVQDEIDRFGFEQVKVLGRLAYADTIVKQNCADILISIEPDGQNPLLKTFMPSKILDYMAAKKPILAITPAESETWKLCKKGYGWAVKPNDDETLGQLLALLIERYSKGDELLPSQNPLVEYTAAYAAGNLVKIMESLCEKN